MHTDKYGNYSLDYGRLVPVLVEAIKEQDAKMDSMQTQLDNYQDQQQAIDSLSNLMANVQNCINNLPHRWRKLK